MNYAVRLVVLATAIAFIFLIASIGKAVGELA